MRWRAAGAMLFSLTMVFFLSGSGASAEESPLTFTKPSVTVEVGKTQEVVLLNITPARATAGLSVEPRAVRQLLSSQTAKQLTKISLGPGESGAFLVKKLGTADGTVIAV